MLSAQTPEQRQVKRIDWFLVTAWLLVGVVALCFGYLSLLRHWAFNSHAFDFGLQHHVVWNTHRGRFFQYTYMVGFNPDLTMYLGDHVQLILLPLSLLYSVHDGPETLLVVQALAVASGVIPLFLLGRLWLKHDLSALMLSLLYVLHPAIQSAVMFDFHPLTVSGSLLIWAFYLAEVERYGATAFALMLALSCKENVALVVALIGVYWLLHGRMRLGGGALVIGAFWFALCFFVILSTFNPGKGSNAFSRYSYLGATWLEVILRLLREPRIVVQRLIEPFSLAYMGGLWAPFGFLNLLSPAVMLVAASEFGLSVLSNYDAQRTLLYQYPVLVVAVSSVATIRSVAFLVRLTERRLRLPGKALALSLVGLLILATMTYQVWRYGTIRVLGWEYEGTYRITAHDHMGARFIGQIPEDAVVSAQGDLAPHVSERPRVYVFPTILDADYVLLDATSEIFPVHLFPLEGLTPEAAYIEYIRRLLEGGQFAVMDREDGWMLLIRAAETQVTPPDEIADIVEWLSRAMTR